MPKKPALSDKVLVENFVSGTPLAAMLLIAKEQIRSERVEASILRQLSKKFGEMLVHRYSDTGPEIARLYQNINQNDLFAAPRFFLLKVDEGKGTKREESLVEKFKPLLGALNTIAASDRLLIVAPSLPATHPVKAFFLKQSAVMELGKLEGKDLNDWLKSLCKEEGLTLASAATLEGIIEAADRDLQKMPKVIEQLALFKGVGEPCSREDVFNLFFSIPDPSEFTLVDSILSGDVIKVEGIIFGLLNRGKSSFMLLSLMARIFTQYVQIAHLLHSNMSSIEIADKLKMKQWSVDRAIRLVDRYPLSRLEGACSKILQADMRLKGRALSEVEVMSDCAWRLMAR